MKKFIEEFKAFAVKGNVIDMAVGVIIGSAFGKIVTSLVNDILMPLIGIIIGGIKFDTLMLKVGDSEIKYGAFIQNIIDFLIIALCVFMFVKIMTRLSNIRKKEVEEKEAEEEKEPEKPADIVLLEQIRDLLEKSNDTSK